MAERGTLISGQRVKVEFEGVVHITPEGERMVYVNAGRDNYTAWVPVSTVTQLDPDHWPPQVGDIWEADGHEYMIRDARSASATTRRNVGYDKGYLLVSPLDHAAPTMRGRYDDLKAANPKLIRRRGGFHK
jgi:hypothetical protein